MAKRRIGDLPPGNQMMPPPPPMYDIPYENYHPIPAMPVVPYEREKSKGKVVSNTVDLADAEKQEQIRYKSLEHDIMPHMLARSIFVSVLLLVVSTALEFFRIELSFLPSFMDVDFSIFPEFVALVFYGPFIGIGIVLLKNIAHMLIFFMINGAISYVGELSNVLTDIIFILIAFVAYNIIINGRTSYEMNRRRRAGSVALSGIISSALTSVILLPIMNYVIYPLFVKYFAANGYNVSFLDFYAEKAPSITSIWQGLLMFNLPWEFSKLVAVTLIATITYYIATRRE